MLQQIQKVKSLHKKVLQRSTHHHSKTSQFALPPNGLKQERCQGTSSMLRKEWPIPPTNNTATATISKPPLKIEPKPRNNQPPVQHHHQKQSNVDGDQKCQFHLQKNIEGDWDGDYQKQFQQGSPQPQQPSALPDPNLSKAPELPVLPITDIQFTG